MNSPPVAQDTLNELREVVALAAERGDELVICGDGSKQQVDNQDAATQDTATRVSTTKLSGIVDHQASDFTITAFAGTPVEQVRSLLKSAGQHLPFDPTFVDRGATIGGLVAAGLNGPCRMRHGGIRDFIIGCQYIDGRGNVVRSGGKVVKNAAGFDIPKFLVGSAGRFGIITEVTFKVFPQPKAYRSILFSTDGLDDALSLTNKLPSLFDFEAIDILEDHSVLARVAGESDTVLDACVASIRQSIATPMESISGSEETSFWRDRSDFRSLPDDYLLIKVPLVPSQILQLNQKLVTQAIYSQYSAGGNVGLLQVAKSSLARLEETLREENLAGQVAAGPSDRYLIGDVKVLPFLKRIKSAMDPLGVFGSVER